MAKGHTHECIMCKKKYTHCDKCRQYNSWRAICCSPECFQAYISPKPVVGNRESNTEKETPKKTK